MSSIKLNAGGETFECEVGRPSDGVLAVQVADETYNISITPQAGAYVVNTGQETQRVHFVREGALLYVHVDGHTFQFEQQRRDDAAAEAGATASLRPPMPGLLTQIFVAAGDTVEEGQPLYAIEAMKMESIVRAPGAGTVTAISVEVGVQVESTTDVVALELA